MQITARAYSKYTGNEWPVVDSPLKKNQLAAAPDGSITVSVSTVDVALSGRYNLAMSVSREEIGPIYRVSIVGATEAKVEKLEKEIANLKKALASAQ